MQNSPGIPLAALVAAIVLGGATIVSVMAGEGGDPALNELQIGAAAWAVTLTAIFGWSRLTPARRAGVPRFRSDERRLTESRNPPVLQWGIG